MASGRHDCRPFDLLKDELGLHGPGCHRVPPSQHLRLSMAPTSARTATVVGELPQTPKQPAYKSNGVRNLCWGKPDILGVLAAACPSIRSIG